MTHEQTDDRAVDDDTADVFRLMYRSHDRIPEDRRKAEHGSLFTEARGNNKAKGITGALLLSRDWFVQTLEGDEAAVRTLFAVIESDPRHDSVSLLETGTVPARAFPRWSMARVSDAADDPDTYLIAHTDGISPATGRGSTPDQEIVLDRMRDAARSAAEVH